MDVADETENSQSFVTVPETIVEEPKPEPEPVPEPEPIPEPEKKPKQSKRHQEVNSESEDSKL